MTAQFTLSIEHGDMDLGDALAMLEQLSGLVDAFTVDGFTATAEEPWYSHEEDMAALSDIHKDTVFKLLVTDDDDTWVKYFLNSGVHREPISTAIPAFDESRVEELVY
jgi:hypothetical protein